MAVGNKSPKQYLGVLARKPPNVIQTTRAPTSTDTAFNIGDLWVDTSAGAAYMNYGGGLWISLGTGTTGSINTITGDSGGAETPLAGNFSILGTANQITVTGGSHKETLSLPSAVTAPGSLTTTTTLASGTTLTAGTSLSVTTSATVGTTITATLGAITATNGNLVLGTAGNKIVIATGSNASVGTSAVMSGTPGAVTIATTASSATAKIFYARNVTGGTPGHVSITAQDGTGFTLTSTGNETSTFNWWIINT